MADDVYALPFPPSSPLTHSLSLSPNPEKPRPQKLRLLTSRHHLLGVHSCVGTVLTANAPYSARAAALTAGFPDNVPVQIINRFCSSGLMAVSTIANQIRNGEIDVGLALGYEHMTAKWVSLSFL